jgi:hypothetical protein
VLSVHVSNKKDEESLPVCLEAKPVERAAADMIGVGGAFSTKETEIRCTRGTETLWLDRISGKVTVLAGNANFWAVGCEDGCLQVNINPYQNFLSIDSVFQYGFSFRKAHMQPKIQYLINHYSKNL